MDEQFERGRKVAWAVAESAESHKDGERFTTNDEDRDLGYFVRHAVQGDRHNPKAEHVWDGSARRMKQRRNYRRRKPEEAARDAKEEPVPEWQADEAEWQRAVVKRCTRCDGKKRDSTCGTCVRLVLQFEKGSP